MRNPGLETTYRAYLDALERRFGDLGAFVRDPLVGNGGVLTRQQYADLIEAQLAAQP